MRTQRLSPFITPNSEAISSLSSSTSCQSYQSATASFRCNSESGSRSGCELDSINRNVSLSDENQDVDNSRGSAASPEDHQVIIIEQNISKSRACKKHARSEVWRYFEVFLEKNYKAWAYCTLKQ
jgi:hypothetical protein